MNVVFDIGAVLVHFDWDGFVGQMFDKPTADAVTRAMWHNPDCFSSPDKKNSPTVYPVGDAQLF